MFGFRFLAMGSVIGLAAGLAGCTDDDHSGKLGNDGGTSTGHLPGLIIVQNGPGGIGAGAVFAGSAPAVCTSQTIGPCVVQRCPNTDTNPPLASAGRITIGDGHASFVMEPDADKSYGYQPPPGATVHFTAGATLTVSTSGGDVPAISGATAVLPADIVPGADYSSIDPSHDLAITWTGGGPSGSVAFFTTTDDPTTVGQLTCSFEPSALRGTVPAAALQAIPPCGASSDNCIWSMTSEADTRITAGDFAVVFSARGNGRVGQRR